MVFHELSHSIVARHYGIEVIDITLLPIGASPACPTRRRTPCRRSSFRWQAPSQASFWLSVSGCSRSVRLNGDAFGSIRRRQSVGSLAAVNFILAVFNLLPAFPMDGGRVLRGVLGLYLSALYRDTRRGWELARFSPSSCFSWHSDHEPVHDTYRAVRLSRRGSRRERQMGIMMSLGGATAKNAMNANVATVSPASTIGEVASLYARGFQADFPVIDDRRLVGLVTRDSLVAALHQDGPSAPVSRSYGEEFHDRGGGHAVDRSTAEDAGFRHKRGPDT